MTPDDKRKLREGLSLLQRGDQGLVLTLLHRESFNAVQERYLKEMLAIVQEGPTPNLFEHPGGAYGRLLGHFRHARRYVTFPRLYVRSMVLGESVIFSMAGNGSKQPGTVAVNNGGAFGKAKHFGRITLNGDLDLAGAAPSGSTSWDDVFEKMLHSMNSSLGEFARHRYSFTGVCIFTDKPLETEADVEIGYSRISALRWFLPYPHKSDA